MSMNSFFATENSATFYLGGVPKSLSSSDRNFRDAVKAASNGEWDEVERLLMPVDKSKIETTSNGRVKVMEDDSVTLDGNAVQPYLARRIVAALKMGLSIDGLCRYTERLARNPSSTARERLTEFLDACNVGIAGDGRLGLYKRVRSDYMDCHSGTIRNAVGDKPYLDRSSVDDDHRRTCSSGLHVCSENYLNFYGGERVMYVLVDPADVVAIPYDYNNSKMRVTTYEVVADITDKYNRDSERFADDEEILSGGDAEQHWDWWDDSDDDDDYTVEWVVEIAANGGSTDFYYVDADSFDRAKVLGMQQAYDEYGNFADLVVLGVYRD